MQTGKLNQGTGGEFVNPISNRTKRVFMMWSERFDHAK
jgi:hypothetical protein